MFVHKLHSALYHLDGFASIKGIVTFYSSRRYHGSCDFNIHDVIIDKKHVWIVITLFITFDTGAPNCSMWGLKNFRFIDSW